MARTLVFDIETIPDPAIEVTDTVRRMAEKREQPVEMFMALCPALCRVVAFGAMEPERDAVASVAYISDGKDNPDGGFPQITERGVLRTAFEWLGRGFNSIVTFNGRSFDIPVLIHRARINGLQAPGILISAAHQKPWEDRPHVDMLHAVTFGGAGSKYPLAAWAIGYGLGDPKEHGDGGQVLDMVSRGDAASLVEYCAGDVKRTAQLFEIWTGKARVQVPQGQAA